MTEAQWAACRNPDRLLDYHTIKSDHRRVRLLVAGCVRLAAAADDPPLVAEVLDAVERYANGEAARAEFLAARKAIRAAIRGKTKSRTIRALATFADDAMEGVLVTLPRLTGRDKAGECELIRCVFGNPYRTTAVAPAWRTATVVALARGITADRGFDRLPVLADALEEAGCDAPAVLEHCRGVGRHARGCWVIDGCLG
jgi:hypothetical protein